MSTEARLNARTIDSAGAALQDLGRPGVRLYTAEQAAERLQCKPRWLKEQARLGRIPVSMIGGSYRFSDRHLEEIISIFERRPQDSDAPASSPRRPSATTAQEEQDLPPLRARRPRRARSSA